MRQGDLFDDLYVEQQTDEGHTHPGHMGCEGLYQGPIEGVIKQRLVTYAKDEFGLEWIKIEVDVQIYNEEAEEYSERYFSKTVRGWIFQKGLQVY